MTGTDLVKVLRVLRTHDEGDGDYCDTGEDIDWHCRSECMQSAIKRLELAFTRGDLD